jgi:anti-sigma factor RsiW
MDHETAVRQNLTERYLLNELDSAARDEFEEHYFDCQQCAADVHAGALFVEQSKAVMASAEKRSSGQERPAVSVRAESAPRSNWFNWLRPAIAVPAFAVLLAIVGYQDYANRRLERLANSPQILASAVINLSVRGTEPISVPAQAGQAIGLTLNLPSRAYSAYALDLYSSQGALEWSSTIPAAGRDSLTISIPAGDVTGSDGAVSKLIVHGISPSGASEELGRYPIELQNPK